MASEPRLPGPLSFADYREERFESDTVKQLLRWCGLAKLRFEMLSQQEELTGRRQLTLVGFQQRFPDFPLVLRVGSVSRLEHDFSIRRLMSQPLDTKLFKSWLNSRQEALPEKATQHFGLVVHWPWLKSGMVLHDALPGERDGMRLTLQQGSYTYTLEPLEQLLAGLSWRPSIPDDYE
jgi:hypothetical protein